MDNKNRQQTKKKRKGGGWWLLALAIIWAVNNLDSDKVRRFFSRLRWSIETGRFDVNGRAAIMAVGVVCSLLAIVICVSVLAKNAREKRFDGITTRRSSSPVSPMSGQSVQHSHDRLSGYRGEENGMEHWKKQLDGFLEAGIIDRAEYKVLLERRRR